jgi:hypothetical protein
LRAIGIAQPTLVQAPQDPAVDKPNACDRRILCLRRTGRESYLLFAGSNSAEGTADSISLKENVMNDELEMELEIVELGDAKEETKGGDSHVSGELGTEKPFRPQ